MDRPPMEAKKARRCLAFVVDAVGRLPSAMVGATSAPGERPA